MTPSATPETSVTDQLRGASQRLVRTVDALPEADWHGPSLLPGWARSHVAAHLALNAEGLARAVRGVVEGRPVATYDSQERRDADIAELGAAAPAAVRERLLASVSELSDALAALAAQPAELAETSIDRTPDGAQRYRARSVPWMRLRGVEIHHVDLARDYSPADWPAEFALRLLDERVRRLAGAPAAALVATDLDQRWDTGRPGPTVSGPVAGLAWWITGRAPYAGLEVTSDDGVLPRIEGM